LDIVGWRGLGSDGGGQEAVLRRVLIIGDGAKWIWEHVATTFGSERVEILDCFHCCEHLWAIGAAAWHRHPRDGWLGRARQECGGSTALKAVAHYRGRWCSATASRSSTETSRRRRSTST